MANETLKLDAVGKELLRAVVRDEVRTEVERTFNATFIDLVKNGTAQMTKIFDAVTAFDKQYEEIKLQLEIHGAAIAGLQDLMDGTKKTS